MEIHSFFYFLYTFLPLESISEYLTHTRFQVRAVTLSVQTDRPARRRSPTWDINATQTVHTVKVGAVKSQYFHTYVFLFSKEGFNKWNFSHWRGEEKSYFPIFF